MNSALIINLPIIMKKLELKKMVEELNLLKMILANLLALREFGSKISLFQA